MKTTPAYNLNVVVKETGIKPDTLRAWERRYGLPQPARTEGGHRLYSERDIGIIQWLNERLDEGLRIKQAVNLWKEMESSGQDPLLVRPIGTQTERVEKSILGESPALNEMREGWVNACLNFDEITAENITNYAFALYPTETVCFEVLLGGLAEIGEAWYRGEASVQQEHFASSLVMRRLDSLIAATPPPSRPGTILVACPPGDDHTIAPLMLTLMLRQRGWKVVYLGANVPKSRFEETILSVKPLIIVMTAQHLASAASLLDIAEFLSQKNIRVAFGGLIFNRNPNLAAGIPGYFLGEQLMNAVQNLEEILTTSPPMPKPSIKSQSYADTLEYYQEVRPQIEAKVVEVAGELPIKFEYISLANHFLSDNIEAAIRIGNLDLIKPELDWIDELIKNYQINGNALKNYIKSYLQAANSIMDDRGSLVIQWLERLSVN
jgi:methanogenic corrinoid protein MtbC1